MVVFAEIDDPANVDSVKGALTKIGVSSYDYNASFSRLHIGIPIALLQQFQTPVALLKFLVSIPSIPHVVGFTVPLPAIVKP